MILWRQALTYIKIVSTVTYIYFLNLTACWYFLFFAVSLRSWMSSCLVEYKAPQLSWPLWWVVSFVLMWRKFGSLGWWKLIGVDSKFTHFLPWLQQLPMQVDKKHTWKNWICCFFCISSLTFCLWDSKINWEFYNVPINLGLFFLLKAHWTSTGSWPHPKRRVGSFSCKLLGSQEAMKKVSL